MISPVFFLCLRVQVDEEEEVKKKRGNADQYVSVVFDDSQHTRSHRCAASSAATSRVDPKSDHCLVSPVILCYAFTEYTTSLTLVSSVVQCGGSVGLFLASEEKIFINKLEHKSVSK